MTSGTDAERDARPKVAEKERGAQTLLATIGTPLWKPLLQRLLDRGLIREEKRKFLGLIPTTRHPTADPRHEEELRRRIRAVLEDGAEPDPRTAALIALLSGSQTLYQLRPPLPWSSEIAARAAELQKGDWGAAAVGTAVTATAAALAATTAAMVAVTVTTTNP